MIGAMSRTTRSALAALLALAATCFAAEQPWREFKSADGSQSFVGQLLAYRKSEEAATVRLKATMQSMVVPLARLSAADQEYVKEQAANLTPAASVELHFDRVVDQTSSERDDKTRTKSFDAGYKIELRSYSSEPLENVEVDYVIVYRKDEVDGLGERLTQAGSKQIPTLAANVTEHIDATGVALENFYKEGTAQVRRRNQNGNEAGSVRVTRPEKRRDVLLGCVARVKVNGKVVLVDGTSTDLVREFGEQLSSVREEPAADHKAKGK